MTSTDPSKCPQEDWTVQAIAAIYMLFSNFLLVNLVIAMFRFVFFFGDNFDTVSNLNWLIQNHRSSYDTYVMLSLVKCPFIYTKLSVKSRFSISIRYIISQHKLIFMYKRELVFFFRFTVVKTVKGNVNSLFISAI